MDNNIQITNCSECVYFSTDGYDNPEWGNPIYYMGFCKAWERNTPACGFCHKSTKRRINDVTKESCLKILKDIKNEIKHWEWDADYYYSGGNSPEEWCEYALNNIDYAIARIEK